MDGEVLSVSHHRTCASARAATVVVYFSEFGARLYAHERATLFDVAASLRHRTAWLSRGRKAAHQTPRSKLRLWRLLPRRTFYGVKLKGPLRPCAISSKKSSVAQSLDGLRLKGSLRFLC